MRSTQPSLTHTLTLVPRASSPAIPAIAETVLPVGDPERYEQLGEHARGGIGRVTRARDRRLGRTVAVKELLVRDALHEERFVREALITARLDHPGIVAVHEAGVWPSGEPYYVMKLVAGRTLHERLAEARDQRERLALLPHVVAVADAVGYAHREGVVHRDIKPANVVCGEFGETVVVDWGLAHDAGLALPPVVDDGVLGTPAYMAPELAAGATPDPRGDVYAIGAILYELLAGAPPYCRNPGRYRGQSRRRSRRDRGDPARDPRPRDRGASRAGRGAARAARDHRHRDGARPGAPLPRRARARRRAAGVPGRRRHARSSAARRARGAGCCRGARRRGDRARRPRHADGAPGDADRAGQAAGRDAGDAAAGPACARDPRGELRWRHDGRFEPRGYARLRAPEWTNRSNIAVEGPKWPR